MVVEQILKQESGQKVDPGEENSPAFNNESGALPTELSPIPSACVKGSS